MSEVTVVDYGMGNIGSILNMFKKIGAAPQVARTPEEIGSAKRLLLPGVGAFDAGMRNLAARGLVEALTRQVLERERPCIGICLGMQLLLERSDEGTLPGLGWVPGETQRLHVEKPLRLPHMGWNTVDVVHPNALLAQAAGETRFYFVHSYGVECRDDRDVVATTTYGHPFVSILQRGNIHGTQFHPEKSHRFGMSLLANFLDA